MADNVQALTKAIGFMAEFKKSGVSINKADLPTSVGAALDSVESDENIPIGDTDTTVGYFHIPLHNTGIEDIFVADYSGDNPDPFRIIVAIQGGNVIGISSEVES